MRVTVSSCSLCRFLFSLHAGLAFVVRLCACRPRRLRRVRLEVEVGVGREGLGGVGRGWEGLGGVGRGWVGRVGKVTV